ncbi:hypothetical protein ANN_12305 [Periplaneta americana]|uniref:Ionotropic glutamate receptor C-terminal domain-containing protein n=1 Tax=Periplaneta americana TaxID=6978 RepID=A0ABQ8TIB3_PERAM|nr:hypothetical protein ANN_12305 [Periplaneta americana]
MTLYQHLRTKYAAVTQHSWGVYLDNKTWSGVIGLVQRREVDIGIGTFAMSSQRSSAVDFFAPMLETRQVNTFTRFLTPDSRILGPESTPRLVSGRLVVVTSYVAAAILFASYSAALVSYLTSKQAEVPFTTFQEFLDDGRYRLGIVKGTTEINYYRNSSDPTLNSMYNTLLVPDLPSSVLESLHRICNDAHYAAMMSASLVDNFRSQISCSLQHLPHSYFPFTVSMIASKGNSYLRIINHNINGTSTNDGPVKRKLQGRRKTTVPVSDYESDEIELDTDYDVSGVLSIFTDSESDVEKKTKSVKLMLKAHSYMVVTYEEELWPGKVLEVKNNGAVFHV